MKKSVEGVLHVIYVILILLKKSAEGVMYVIYVISILLKKSVEGVMYVIYVISILCKFTRGGNICSETRMKLHFCEAIEIEIFEGIESERK